MEGSAYVKNLQEIFELSVDVANLVFHTNCQRSCTAWTNEGPSGVSRLRQA